MIEVNNLIKKFDDFYALNGVNMNVGEGDIYGLVGPNGAGKSTLIRHLTGVYRQDAGEIYIDGEEVYENRKVKSEIAYIPDELFYFLQADTLEMKRYYKGIYESFDEKMFERMKKYFPAWYKKYPNCAKGSSYLSHYAQMRWDLTGKKVMSDPDGYRNKSAKAILKDLLGD